MAYRFYLSPNVDEEKLKEILFHPQINIEYAKSSWSARLLIFIHFSVVQLDSTSSN